MTWKGVHWFAGTTRQPVAQVVEQLAGVLQLAPLDRSSGGYGYHRSTRVGGSTVFWTPGREDVFLVVPGSECEVLGVAGLVALATLLDLVPSSRLDLAWDCEGVDVEDFAGAFERGDVLTRIHRDVNPATGYRRGIERRQNHEGRTAYLGSRASERFIRVYDRRGPVRLEMEWKGQRAVLLWQRLLAAAAEDWSAEAMSELRAFLDFRDRSADENGSRCPLLPWWAGIVGDAGRACALVPRQRVTLDDVRSWVKRQVVPSLALVFDAAPDPEQFIRQALAEGRGRYRQHPERLALLDAEQLRLGLRNAAD